MNLLKTPKPQIVQALIASELAKTGGKALWIDSDNMASTYTLNQFGGQKTMENVEISRVFTPFQHFNAFQKLEKHTSKELNLVCVTGATRLYREEGLNSEEGEELFREAWRKLRKQKEKHRFKILATLPEPVSVLGYPVVADTDKEIKVEETGQGLKFESENYEQLAYSRKESLQTTMKYWKNRETRKKAEQVEKVKN